MGTQPLSPKIKVCLGEEKRGTLKGGQQRATVSLVEKRPVNKGENDFPEMVCRFCLVLQYKGEDTGASVTSISLFVSLSFPSLQSPFSPAYNPQFSLTAEGRSNLCAPVISNNEVGGSINITQNITQNIIQKNGKNITLPLSLHAVRKRFPLTHYYIHTLFNQVTFRTVGEYNIFSYFVQFLDDSSQVAQCSATLKG